MWVAICYDIPDDRRRWRLARLLLGYGQRVQRSVFEAELTPAQLQQVKARIRRLLHLDEDSVRIYYLCADCRRQTEVLAGPPLVEMPDAYIY